MSDVLNTVYGTGWAFGTEDALEDISPRVGFDWDSWQAGNEAAAALVDPPAGLQQLLASKDILIRDISDTTLNRIGSALALSLSQGLGAAETANAINYVLDNPARALTIARTETARALIEANLAEYRDAKVETVEWLVGDPCDLCAQNAGQKVTMGQAFPSGNVAPPAHPNCVCDLAPVSKYDTEVIGQGRITEGDAGYVSKPDLNDLVSDINWNQMVIDKTLENENSENGLTSLALAFNRYNYHTKPTISSSEFEALKNAGQPVVYRGVVDSNQLKADQIQQRFKTGETHWAGKGIYGNGTYSTTSLDTALQYGGYKEKNVIQMVIRPEAKMIKFNDLVKMWNKERDDLRDSYMKAIANATVEEAAKLKEQYEIADKFLSNDISAYAVSRGYDVVFKLIAGNPNMPEETFYIILNRSAVVVNE